MPLVIRGLQDCRKFDYGCSSSFPPMLTPLSSCALADAAVFKSSEGLRCDDWKAWPLSDLRVCRESLSRLSAPPWPLQFDRFVFAPIFEFLDFKGVEYERTIGSSITEFGRE